MSDRTSALLPVHVFGYPADMVALERLGVPIVEDACEALGAVYADGGHGRRTRSPDGVRVLRQQAAHDRRGRDGRRSPIPSSRSASTPSATRDAPRTWDWLDHDRLGFNYRLSDIACALGLAQLERLDGLLSDRARVAGLYRQALAEVDGLELPCHDAAGARRGWFVFVVQLPRGVDRDETVGALGALGIPSKPYFPAIHLMSFYRERFGYREGEFPVCEDVAARSIALPFFPEMTEGQVDRVAQALASVLARAEVRR